MVTWYRYKLFHVKHFKVRHLACHASNTASTTTISIRKGEKNYERKNGNTFNEGNKGTVTYG